MISKIKQNWIKIKFSSCFAHQADITTQYCNTPNDYTITTVRAMETNQSYFQFLSKIQIPLGHSMVQLEIKSQQFTATKIENWSLPIFMEEKLEQAY